ncbi:MAG TPA: CDP-diacylglycerol--serine O-phosphatidyltransferase [Candidatus Competibacteraceae bacterium]|nr:CDP-diacylglycerol--serine O-phosphatidyltransferase [Candidatus Competibacteraceae bacterium]
MIEDEQPKRPRGIYLLPNLFTTAALFSGFYAIVAAIHGHFESAAIAVFIAMVMDGLDGRVARLTNTSSAFGAEYDSLADMVSFGLAPALIMYEWALRHMATLGWAPAKLGWLAAFIYTAGAALRLARFNVQLGSVDKRYFIGLPSPSAAAIMVGLVWVGNDLEVLGKQWLWLAFVVTIGAGLLMVSNFLYYSFKQIDLKGRVPFAVPLAVVLAFVLLSINPPRMLFTVFLLYGLSGPALWLFRQRQRLKRRQQGRDDASPPNA